MEFDSPAPFHMWLKATEDTIIWNLNMAVQFVSFYLKSSLKMTGEHEAQYQNCG
jgi:hypothetical protein